MINHGNHDENSGNTEQQLNMQKEKPDNPEIIKNTDDQQLHDSYAKSSLNIRTINSIYFWLKLSFLLSFCFRPTDLNK